MEACNTSKIPNKEKINYNGQGTPNNTVYINVDTILTDNPPNTAYIVTNGAILDLGGYKIDARNKEGKHFTGVTLHNGSSVINGTIAYGGEGIVVHTNPEPGWQTTLTNLPQEERADYIKYLEAQVTTSSRISNVTLTLNRIGVYVTAFSNGSILKNNTFIKGRLGVYLDTYSHDAQIVSNLFSEVGKDYFRKKFGFSFPYARETIAIDNSSNNLIEGNTIIGSERGGIYLYKNCGEVEAGGTLPLPREGGSNDNTIRSNYFKDISLNKFFPKDEPAIWVASRKLDRLTKPCRKDDKGDIVLRTVIENNRFEEVNIKIKDDS
jgi:parallel beta-helix repeat protein